jgi:hypothetical protein
MKMRIGLCAALALAAVAAPAAAQVKRAGAVINSPAVMPITLPDGSYITPSVTVTVDKDGTPVGPAARDQSVPLATANAPSGPATLYGGNYILTQLCTGYGSVALRYRAPDGATMVTLTTKSSPDTAGTLLQFGSGQVVDVALTSTTGCNVILSRVP